MIVAVDVILMRNDLYGSENSDVDREFTPKRGGSSTSNYGYNTCTKLILGT